MPVTGEKGAESGFGPGGLTPGCFLCHYYYAASQVEGETTSGTLDLRLLRVAGFVISLFPRATYTNTSKESLGLPWDVKTPFLTINVDLFNHISIERAECGSWAMSN